MVMGNMFTINHFFIRSFLPVYGDLVEPRVRLQTTQRNAVQRCLKRKVYYTPHHESICCYSRHNSVLRLTGLGQDVALQDSSELCVFYQ
jgi:uncharacterized membrane protein